MKKLYMLMTLLGFTFTAMAMDYPQVQIRTTDGETFSVDSRHLQCSRTFQDMIEALEPAIDTPLAIGLSSDQSKFVQRLLQFAFDIKNHEDVALPKFEEYLQNQSDEDLITIHMTSDYLAIAHIETPILCEIKNRLLTSGYIKKFMASQNPECYNPFNLPCSHEAIIAPMVIKKCFAKNILPAVSCLSSINADNDNENADDDKVCFCDVVFLTDKIFVTGSEDGTIKFWISTDTGVQLIGTIDHFNNNRILNQNQNNDDDANVSVVCSLARSHDGKVLVSGAADGSINIFHITLNNTQPLPQVVVRRFALPMVNHGDVNSIVFTQKANIFISASENGVIKVWRCYLDNPNNVNIQVETIKQNTVPVTALAISLDGSILVAALNDETIQIWNVTDPFHAKFMATIEPNKSDMNLDNDEDINQVNSITLRSDGKILAIGLEDGTIQVWDIADPSNAQRVATIDQKNDDHAEGYVSFVAFSPNNNILVSASEDGTIILWDITDLGNIQRITTTIDQDQDQHNAPVLPLAFNTDGNILASISDDGTLKLWDVALTAFLTLVKNITLPEALLVYSSDSNDEKVCPLQNRQTFLEFCERLFQLDKRWDKIFPKK